LESEILVKRAIGIFLIVISSLLGQIDSFYISPEGGETTSVLNDYYAGAQQYYTTGCDDNLNFAVAYFIPGHEGSIFFALYKKSGKEILTKLIPLDSNTETAIPHIALAGKRSVNYTEI